MLTTVAMLASGALAWVGPRSLPGINVPGMRNRDRSAHRVNMCAQPPISAESPCDFPWWSSACTEEIAQLDSAGGERFIAYPCEQPDTQNWLHVTKSSPLRRFQYEMRWVASEQMLGGIVRFGADCEGPPGTVHGGAIATVADAATATATFRAAERWGLTTKLECNYREMIPLETPVLVKAHVTVLKPRRSTIEWQILSLAADGADPVRYAFGVADFLLERKPKAPPSAFELSF